MPAWKAASSAGSMLVIARYGRLRGIVANRIERLDPFAKTSVKLIRSSWTFRKPNSTKRTAGAWLQPDTDSVSAGDEQLVPVDRADLECPLERAHAPRA